MLPGPIKLGNPFHLGELADIQLVPIAFIHIQSSFERHVHQKHISNLSQDFLGLNIGGLVVDVKAAARQAGDSR